VRKILADHSKEVDLFKLKGNAFAEAWKKLQGSIKSMKDANDAPPPPNGKSPTKVGN